MARATRVPARLYASREARNREETRLSSWDRWRGPGFTDDGVGGARRMGCAGARGAHGLRRAPPGALPGGSRGAGGAGVARGRRAGPAARSPAARLPAVPVPVPSPDDPPPDFPRSRIPAAPPRVLALPSRPVSVIGVAANRDRGRGAGDDRSGQRAERLAQDGLGRALLGVALGDHTDRALRVRPLVAHLHERPDGRRRVPARRPGGPRPAWARAGCRSSSPRPGACPGGRA